MSYLQDNMADILIGLHEIQGRCERLIAENERLKAENRALMQQVPPLENGTNRYGLDVSYFRKLINRELNRGLSDFKPDELARVFARMSKAADSEVLKEREFCTD